IIPKNHRAPQPQADRNHHHRLTSPALFRLRQRLTIQPFTSIISQPIGRASGTWLLASCLLDVSTSRLYNSQQYSLIAQGLRRTTFITVQLRVLVAHNQLPAPQMVWDAARPSAHTTLGAGNRSKSTWFNIFADWMNKLNPDLNLSGRRLSLRLTSYKRVYTRAKDYKRLMKQGGDKGHGIDMLEQICPCFERIDCIFNNLADISPIMLDNHPLPPLPIIAGTNRLAGHAVLTGAIFCLASHS
ncbi:hypothetical protein KEM48_005889, partial [Puccinia striiformis f. sp. tritici PST-130]